jgi:hypothetical protein
MSRIIITGCACAALTVLAAGCGTDDQCVLTNNGIEACDGIDNNCNGQIDEGCSSCTPTNGGIEICDSIDNNCNGQVDEGGVCGACMEGQTQGCGGSPTAGVCSQRCVGGNWAACQPVSGSYTEVCGDSLDNNCNNQVDEQCECTPTRTQPCGGSPTANLCIETCGADGRWQPCAPNPPNPGTEICDNLDNDCDGSLDEGIECTCDAGQTQYCGGTPERHSCQQTCTGGSWGDCLPTSGGSRVEACGDAEDNDCDGRIDEPEACRNDCGAGEARCEGSTRGACVVPGVACQPGDEEVRDCTGEDRGICDPGTQSHTCRTNCTWNDWGRCEGAIGPRPSETCNGQDDDCDGTTDEDATGSDSYGENGDCYGSRSVGTDPDVTLYAMLSGEDDWFSFTGVDNFSLFFAETVQVDVTSYSGADLGLELYFDACASEPIASADHDGSGPEHLEWAEELGGDTVEDGEYYVRVVNWFSRSGCYEIHINGLN